MGRYHPQPSARCRLLVHPCGYSPRVTFEELVAAQLRANADYLDSQAETVLSTELGEPDPHFCTSCAQIVRYYNVSSGECTPCEDRRVAACGK